MSHCNELYHHTAPDDEMWATMKKYNCAMASTPEDELGMAHGEPPIFEAVERGIRCGLGVVSVKYVTQRTASEHS